MDIESTVAPAEEANNTEPGISEPADEAKADAKPSSNAKPKEETIGDLLDVKPSREEARTVPEAKFLEQKKALKAAQDELKSLKAAKEDGASKKEINTSLDKIVAKYKDTVDPEFLQEFAQTVRDTVKKDLEEEVTQKIKPLEEKERAKEIDRRFDKAFSKAMEALPEFSKVVNQEAIKALSLSPSNSHKTLTQLIEETYGNSVEGKRSMDAASSRAGKSDAQEVDERRAQSDKDYFEKEVMANPAMKKKYNDGLIDRLKGSL